MAKELFIPKLGQTVEEVTIIRWLVEDGSKVTEGQEILEVETDKAVFPIESCTNGFIHFGPYQEGNVIHVLEVVAIIGEQSDTFEVKGKSTTEEVNNNLQKKDLSEFTKRSQQSYTQEVNRIFISPRAKKLGQKEKVDFHEVKPTGGGGVRITENDVMAFLNELPKATPIAKKMIEDFGLNLSTISGTGSRGMITKTDVERVLQEKKSNQPKQFIPTGFLQNKEIICREELKGPRRITSERMALSSQETARVTLLIDVDATSLVDLRGQITQRIEQEWGFSPSYNELIIKITAIALREFPYMNSRLVDGAIEQLKDVNIGVAVDTERGLLVPVIKDADKKSIIQIGLEFRKLMEQARNNRIQHDDLLGGTFTITNLGMYDVIAFTPIINLPEAAILGLGKIKKDLVPINDEIVIRNVVTLSLAFDHRVVDGAPAARFLQFMKEVIEGQIHLLTETVF